MAVAPPDSPPARRRRTPRESRSTGHDRASRGPAVPLESVLGCGLDAARESPHDAAGAVEVADRDLWNPESHPLRATGTRRCAEVDALVTGELLQPLDQPGIVLRCYPRKSNLPPVGRQLGAADPRVLVVAARPEARCPSIQLDAPKS